jgi:hypothetical protein
VHGGVNARYHIGLPPRFFSGLFFASCIQAAHPYSRSASANARAAVELNALSPSFAETDDGNGGETAQELEKTFVIPAIADICRPALANEHKRILPVSIAGRAPVA